MLRRSFLAGLTISPWVLLFGPKKNGMAAPKTDYSKFKWPAVWMSRHDMINFPTKMTWAINDTKDVELAKKEIVDYYVGQTGDRLAEKCTSCINKGQPMIILEKIDISQYTYTKQLINLTLGKRIF